MRFPTITETPAELAALERRNPLMLKRLRCLRLLRANPMLSISTVADQLGVTESEIERWGGLYTLGGIKLLLDPRTVADRQAAQKLTFSEHAENKMWDLLKAHQNQLGRQLWVDYESCVKTGQPKPGGAPCTTLQPYQEFAAKFNSWYRTDCQTYILHVLKYAYEKIGRRDIYTGLHRQFTNPKNTTGTVMAKYLVQNGWKAYLFLPDTDNPSDRSPKHTAMYRSTLKTKTWWGVPVTDFIVNYNPTPTTGTQTPTPKDAAGMRKFEALSGVRFAVCVFTEGLHTGLFSKGMIYEVHWRSLSEQSRVDNPNYAPFYVSPLYEHTALWGFAWLEGVILVPPDSNVAIG